MIPVGGGEMATARLIVRALLVLWGSHDTTPATANEEQKQKVIFTDI